MQQNNEEMNEVAPRSEDETVLSILKTQNVLTDRDWSDLNESKEFIKDCFTTIPMYRPLPVKIFGVLNDSECPTPEAKYWQCKLEAEVHADQLIEDIHNLEMLRITVERLEFTLARMYERYDQVDDSCLKKEIEFDIRENKVRLSKLEYKIVKMKKQIKYRIEEVHEWKKISSKIEEEHANIETQSYVKQYVNNMKTKLALELNKKERQEDIPQEEKQRLASQMNSFDRIIKQLESI